MFGFFYRLNNILLTAFIIFAGFLIYSRLQYAQSRSDDANTPPEVYLINREVDVSIKPGSFTARFVSDGFTSEPTKEQKAKFLSKPDNSPPELGLIDIPITFNFDPKGSKLILPGELVYPAIPKANAPVGYRCVKKGSAGDDTENRRNCLFNVQSLSVYTNLVASSVVIGDREFKVKEGENFFERLIASLLSVDFALGKIITDTGLTDPTRTAIGTVRYWGDDDFQQFVPINEKVIFEVQARTSSTGVNISEGLFPTDLSSELDAQISMQYRRPNILRARMDKIVGAGEIYDPITSVGQNHDNRLGTTIAEFLMHLVTSSNQKFTQRLERISNQVALRPIHATTEFNAKYNLCDAFASNPSRFSYLREYPNPYGKFQPEFVTAETPLYGGVLDERKNPNPLYLPWKNYENLSSKIKKCIDGIARHVGPSFGKNCALKLAKDPKAGCDEFSVEEEKLNLSIMDQTFPVGLGAYFQNSTLKGVQPSLKGPFLNYLSPSLCAKLNLSFQIKAGASYMYHVGGKNGKTSHIVNEYCVLGGVISNFSWAMTSQLSNFSSDVADGLFFNLPKEALTCDKKEIAHFGATHVKTNIPSANNEPVYIVDDNIRGGGITNDEVVIYRGYNAYSLSRIFNNELKGKTLFKYRAYDMHVLLDSSTKRPKYFISSVKMNPETIGLYICKIPLALESESLGSKKTQKSYCKLVEQGKFILPYGSGLKRHEVRPDVFIDTITVLYNDPDMKIMYKYIDVVDENDIQASIVSPQYKIAPKDTMVSSLQLNDGNLAAGYLARANNTIVDIGVRVLDPTVKAGAKYEFDTNGKITSVTRSEANFKDISGNLCDTTPKYCPVLNHGQYVDRVAIAQSDTGGGVYVAAVSAGKGVVYAVDPTGRSKNVNSYVFGYKPKSNTYLDETDRISAMRVDKAGDIHIFLGISGFYLHLISQNNVTNKNVLENIHSACGINCLPTVQMQFDPEQFITDCSDYKGSGACGFPSMNKLGPPIVTDFAFTSNGNIRARYVHAGLEKTLLESEDFLYSMSGVYSRLDDNGPEVSNVYIPGPLSSKPIRYFNQGNGGLQIGQDVDENLRESILFKKVVGSGVSPAFNGYDKQNKIEKMDCLIQYSSKKSIGDVYYQQSGINPINLNPTTISETVSSHTSSSSNTSNNTGEYCEETWCIPDEIPFVGNPMFANDTNNNELKQRIANYLNRDISYINRLCAVASEKGVSCALIASIWKAESSASTVEPSLDPDGKAAVESGRTKVPEPRHLTSGPQFGCMLYSTSYCRSEEGQRDPYCQKWYTFENQIKCAVNSIVNRYNEYRPGIVISGPTDRIGKPYVTNANRGGGSCVPATRFSYVMQRYTPIDKRINNDNQCNKGLVVRDKNLQDAYCDGIKPSASSRNSAGEAALPEDWGNIIKSRPNMQNSLINMDPRLRADESRCFPSNIVNNTPASGDENITNVLTGYDVASFTETKGIVKLDLKVWGTDDSAGNVYMALRMLNNGKLEGVHVLSPGQEFSFNDTIGNPNENEVRELMQRVSKIKAPWNSSNFTYDGSMVVGGGWCELSTGIRMAADALKGKDGTTLKQVRFTDASAVGAPALGNGTGYQGDINHWTHSGYSLYQSYNNLLVSGFGVPLQGPDKFVAIWTQPLPSKRTGFNDADLILRNPYSAGSGIDMIITLKLGDDGIITIETMFGKKITDSRPTDACSPLTMVPMDVKGPGLWRDNSGRIVAGTALVQPAAEAYEKARTEIKDKTGVDVLGTVADMLRIYSAAPTNANSIDKSWHKTGRAVDLNLGSGMGNICSNNLCQTGRVRDGKYWRLYYNGVDVTAIMEKYGWTRIPDQCSHKPGRLCAEWWHYEYKIDKVSWEQAMLQVWKKEELKSYFKDVDWDNIPCRSY